MMYCFWQFTAHKSKHARCSEHWRDEKPKQWKISEWRGGYYKYCTYRGHVNKAYINTYKADTRAFQTRTNIDVMNWQERAWVSKCMWVGVRKCVYIWSEGEGGMEKLSLYIMCVCAYVFASVCVSKYAWMCLRWRVCEYGWVCWLILRIKRKDAHTNLHMRIHSHSCMSVGIYACKHTHTCTVQNMATHIHIPHIHTHTQTFVCMHLFIFSHSFGSLHLVVTVFAHFSSLIFDSDLHLF